MVKIQTEGFKRLVEYAISLGFESENLQEVLDEEVLDRKCEEGADINNAGLEDQLAYLLSGFDGAPVELFKKYLDNLLATHKKKEEDKARG